MKKDDTLINGEPWNWENRCMYPHVCCDCGLTHMICIDVVGEKIKVRFYRDSYETNKNRKEEKIIVYRKRNEKNKTP